MVVFVSIRFIFCVIFCDIFKVFFVTILCHFRYIFCVISLHFCALFLPFPSLFGPFQLTISLGLKERLPILRGKDTPDGQLDEKDDKETREKMHRIEKNIRKLLSWDFDAKNPMMRALASLDDITSEIEKL